MDRTKNRKEPISPYAVDPFVALPTGDDLQLSAKSQKTIEEILETLNGYPDPSLRNLAATQSKSKSDSLNDQTSKIDCGNSHPTSFGVKNMNQDQIEGSILKPANVAQSTATANFDEPRDEFELPEFDVRAFCSLDEAELQTPEPIRSAFDVDQDFFDYAMIDTRLDHAEKLQNGLPAVVAPRQSEQGLPEEVFWAGPGDLIFIDGKDGYGYIDLACFDISTASFEANQIRIQMDESTQFQVDYRNVTHALFADNVEIELAANETGFSPNK